MLRSEDFANQLCMLNDKFPIEYNGLDFVSKWLPTLLMDDESTPATKEEFPIITKKVRDEVLGNEGDCFRRSGKLNKNVHQKRHHFNQNINIGVF